MTIAEALQARIPRVRKARWVDPTAYLRLPLFADGSSGPWAELYEDRVQRDVLSIRPGSQRLLLIQMFDDDGYDRYTGPVSPYETHVDNFASAYAEA